MLLITIVLISKYVTFSRYNKTLNDEQMAEGDFVFIQPEVDFIKFQSFYFRLW